MRSILIALLLVLPLIAQSKTKKKVIYRKTQEVSFDGSDVDGAVRSPDGAYLHQKKGVKFVPLYQVHQEFDRKILETADFLR